MFKLLSIISLSSILNLYSSEILLARNAIKYTSLSNTFNELTSIFSVMMFSFIISFNASVNIEFCNGESTKLLYKRFN